MPTLEDITPDMALPHNVFAEMGLSNPETRQAKAYLSILIEQRIDALKITQAQAAKRMGLRQPEVSKIVRGVNGGFSIDRLLEALTALGNGVDIVVRDAAPDQQRGALSVIVANNQDRRSRSARGASPRVVHIWGHRLPAKKRRLERAFAALDPVLV